MLAVSRLFKRLFLIYRLKDFKAFVLQISQNSAAVGSKIQNCLPMVYAERVFFEAKQIEGYSPFLLRRFFQSN